MLLCTDHNITHLGIVSLRQAFGRGGQAHLADWCDDEGLHAGFGAVAVLLAEPRVYDVLHTTFNLCQDTLTGTSKRT